MAEPAFSLPDGETLLKDSSENHLLRPAVGIVGRYCHPFLTNRRLLVCEAYYDILKKREKGVGSIIQDIALDSIESLRSSAETAEPHLELDVRNERRELEKVFLFFRDEGWAAGAPARAVERDAWMETIGGERARMGRPLTAYRPVAATAASTLPPSRAPAEPAAGPRTLGGQFELMRELGSGGMGVVFEGRDVKLDRPVAIKKMRPDVQMSGRDKALFMKEAKLSAALHHPFIVDIYAILEEGSEIFLVFEYVDGETLQERLDDKGAMKEDKVRGLLKGVCEALSYAHSRKVVHRDIKPSNIMVTRQGYPKVMDFGISRQLKDTASRASTTKMDTSGTLPYMAPEQELGRSDARSDLFSLGATVYELLAGELPYVGPNFYLQKEKADFIPLAEAAPGVADDLARAVERCLRFDAKERFQSVAEFAAAIGAG